MVRLQDVSQCGASVYSAMREWTSLFRIRVDILRFAGGDLNTRIMLSQEDEFKDFAETMNGMAADLVIGHHPHVVQAPELVRAGGDPSEAVLLGALLLLATCLACLTCACRAVHSYAERV